MIDFEQIKFLDILDWLIVAFLIYQVYKIIKGTVAIRIFAGIFSIYILWKLVGLLNMKMLTEILGQFIGVGVIALIIVFQQEIRRFLLMIGTPGFLNENKNAKAFFNWFKRNKPDEKIKLQPIFKAVKNMASTSTGALIIIAQKSNLNYLIETGEEIDANLSTELLESIFFKNSPLHDGAVLIIDNRIKAARCVLPLSHNSTIPGNYGMRHRAALGISETTDAIAIIVSEQTGDISLAINGNMIEKLTFEKFIYELQQAVA